MRRHLPAALALLVGLAVGWIGRAPGSQAPATPMAVHVTDTRSGREFRADVVATLHGDRPATRTGVESDGDRYRIDLTYLDGRTLVLFCVAR
jgi:hypothetical protein